MKRKILTSCAFLIFFLSAANAQRTCGTMSHMAMQQAADPAGFAKRMQLIEQQVQRWKQKNAYSKTGKKVVITIPIVFHVVWNTSSQNISDAQIFSQIDVLNEDFRRLNADATNTPSWFTGVTADCEIEFCLAQRDPSGVATNGITRTQTSVTSFSMNDDVKFTSQGGKDAWPRDDYLNFWVCNLGGLLGYAEYPGGSASTDGVVCTHTSIGRPPDNPFSAPFNLGRTATHEIGHWLNLYHTFQNGCAGTSSSTCGTQGDRVCDTPPTSSSNFGCPSINQNTCTETPVDENDQHMNYMDYTDDACMYLFTQEQKTRMVSVLNGARLSIQSSLGCIPLNMQNLDAGISAIITPDGSICGQATINPVVTLKNFGLNTLTSVTINYDIDGGPNNPYSWTGSLASFATEDVTLPSIAVPAGTHTFNASTSNPNGSTDEDIINDTKQVSFNSVFGNVVTLTLTTDDYGSETTWEVTDLLGAVLYSGGPYSNLMQTYIEEFCLEGVCYDFTIYDSFGDGMCCTYGNGSYLVEDESGDTLAFGGSFSSQDTTNFCLSLSTAPPIAAFTTGSTIICAGGSVTFIDQSTENPISWSWTFQGGTPSTSNAQDPIVTYNTAGTYNVTLNVTNNNGNDTKTINGYITVNANPLLTTNYTNVSADTICDGEAIANVSGGNPPYIYSWNDSLNQTTDTATGLCMETYNVIVTDGNGCTATASVFVDSILSGIAETRYANSVNIYPNPTTGHFYLSIINLKNPSKLNIKIYNMMGEIVTQINDLNNFLKIDLTNQANGIYYVEIRTDSDVIVKKVSLVR